MADTLSRKLTSQFFLTFNYRVLIFVFVHFIENRLSNNPNFSYFPNRQPNECVYEYRNEILNVTAEIKVCSIDFPLNGIQKN